MFGKQNSTHKPINTPKMIAAAESYKCEVITIQSEMIQQLAAAQPVAI